MTHPTRTAALALLLTAALTAATLTAPAAAADPHTACSVDRVGAVTCWEDAEAMYRAHGVAGPPTPGDALAGSEATTPGLLAPGDTCNFQRVRWMYLYSGTSYTGSVLAFQDTGYWANLVLLGFNNTTSSVWNNTTCTGYLATGTGGSGTISSVAGGTAQPTLPSAVNNNASSVCLWGAPGGICS